MRREFMLIGKICSAAFIALAAFTTAGHAQQTPESGQNPPQQQGNAYWINLPQSARESILQHNGGNIPPAYQLYPPPKPRRLSPEEITARSNALIQNAQAEHQIGAPPIGDGWWYVCDRTQVFYPWGGCPVKWRQVQPTSGEELPPKPSIPRWADGNPIGNNPVSLKMYNDNLNRLENEYVSKIHQAQEDAKRRVIFQEQAQAKNERKKIDERNGYKYITVSDFDLDKYGMSLGRKLIISGIFVSAGEVDYLTQIPNGNGPKIGLISDGAPRPVRANLQRCRIGGMCSITLVGHVGACQHTFLNRGYKADRCLFVDGQR